MKSTDQLEAEHRGIGVMLRVLDVVAGRIEGGKTVPPADLDAILEFLSVFADRCHHGKEEEHLFPALEAAGVPREGGPIGVLLEEHRRGRALIASMTEAAAALKAGKPGAAGRFAASARDYIALLTEHIRKENEVLFRLAGARLNPRQDRAILKAFDRLEIERIGEGRHEQFHALLERLDETYPA